MIREDQIKKDCWDNALHALGTSYVFELKAKFCKIWIRVITILSLVVPLLIGATAAAYGQNSKILTIAIAIAAPATVFQIVLSGISLVVKWDDLLAYALESQTDNRIISLSLRLTCGFLLKGLGRYFFFSCIDNSLSDKLFQDKTILYGLEKKHAPVVVKSQYS